MPFDDVIKFDVDKFPHLLNLNYLKFSAYIQFNFIIEINLKILVNIGAHIRDK